MSEEMWEQVGEKEGEKIVAKANAILRGEAVDDGDDDAEVQQHRQRDLRTRRFAPGHVAKLGPRPPSAAPSLGQIQAAVRETVRQELRVWRLAIEGTRGNEGRRNEVGEEAQKLKPRKTERGED